MLLHAYAYQLHALLLKLLTFDFRLKGWNYV